MVAVALLEMRQRSQLPPQFFVQEHAHALVISYKTSACMHEVNYITDLTRGINRDLMVGKRPAALITTFFTKWGRKSNLFSYMYVLLRKCAMFS